MSRPQLTRIKTENAPAAKPVYSQAVRNGGVLYVSGCLGADKASGALAPDFAGQARQCLENLKAVVEAGGSTLDNTVKVTVLLSDIKNYGALNDIYAEYFPEGQTPARTAYAVSALPLNALVEIDAIAALPRKVRERQPKKQPAAASAPAPADETSAPQPDPCSVFVAKLPLEHTEEQLRDAFHPFGEIADVSAFKAKRFRYVKFTTQESAEAAVLAGSKGEIKIADTVLNVQPRKVQPRRQPRNKTSSQTASGTESDAKAPRRRQQRRRFPRRKQRQAASDATPTEQPQE